jgi:hypothetical protein
MDPLFPGVLPGSEGETELPGPPLSPGDWRSLFGSGSPCSRSRVYRPHRNFFPGQEPVPDRYGFVGTDASDTIRRMYLGKRLPDEFRKQGAANPIKYTYR